MPPSARGKSQGACYSRRVSIKQSSSITATRKHLPTLVAQAAGGLTTTITRHGKPVAVLMPADEYAALVAGTMGVPKS